MADTDAAFGGSIPEMYERCLGLMLFAPYAADLVERAKTLDARRVLEIAAGTGILTSLLANALPRADIEATDLNKEMVTFAAARSGLASVRWSTADAMALPFDDNRLDLVVCQFGVMFFADRARALREAGRVLTPGAAYLFNVWDSLEHNDVARIVSDTAVAAFPDDPPLFLKRTPYGHGDPTTIECDLRAAGFDDVTCVAVAKRSIAAARDASIGLCEGTPLRHEILSRDAKRLPDVVARATRALQVAFGGDTVDGAMRAYVFSARKAMSPASAEAT